MTLRAVPKAHPRRAVTHLKQMVANSTKTFGAEDDGTKALVAKLRIAEKELAALEMLRRSKPPITSRLRPLS